jgi:1-acyl-sn-glycerol-3-phosphate acyltransferase
MNASADSWVIGQRDRYRMRRIFCRDVLFKYLAPLFWKMTVTGLENIPPDGPVILMINHMAAPDPLWVVSTTRPRFVVPMSKIENFQHPIFRVFVWAWGAYPIHRDRVDREALKTALQLMDAGEITLIAPEGTRHHALQRSKDGLAFIATRSNAVIVPTAIHHTEGWQRDVLAPWRRTPVHVTYGPAFRLRTGGRTRIPREAMRQMSDEMMYQLARLLPAHNRGEYSNLDAMTTTHLDFINPARKVS